MVKRDACGVVWKMEVYRYARFAADLAWFGISKLGHDHRMIGLSEQQAEYRTSPDALLNEVPLP
jgi:hypothetical protein